MAAITKYKSTVWRDSSWKCEAEGAHTEGSWLDVSLWVSTVQLGDTLWAFKIQSGPILHWIQILSEFSSGASHDYSRILSRTQWNKKYSHSHSEWLWAAATASWLPGQLWAAAGRKTRYIEHICSSCQQTTLPSTLLQLWSFQADETVLGLLRNQGIAGFLPCNSEESQKFLLS